MKLEPKGHKVLQLSVLVDGTPLSSALDIVGVPSTGTQGIVQTCSAIYEPPIPLSLEETPAQKLRDTIHYIVSRSKMGAGGGGGRQL